MFESHEIAAHIFEETRPRRGLLFDYEAGCTADDRLSKVVRNDFFWRTKQPIPARPEFYRARRQLEAQMRSATYDSALRRCGAVSRHDGSFLLKKNHPLVSKAMLLAAQINRRRQLKNEERFRKEMRRRAIHRSAAQRGQFEPYCHPEKKHYAKGLCWSCYRRNLKTNGQRFLGRDPRGPYPK